MHIYYDSVFVVFLLVLLFMFSTEMLLNSFSCAEKTAKIGGPTKTPRSQYIVSHLPFYSISLSVYCYILCTQ